MPVDGYDGSVVGLDALDQAVLGYSRGRQSGCDDVDALPVNDVTAWGRFRGWSAGARP